MRCWERIAVLAILGLVPCASALAQRSECGQPKPTLGYVSCPSDPSCKWRVKYLVEWGFNDPLSWQYEVPCCPNYYVWDWDGWTYCIWAYNAPEPRKTLEQLAANSHRIVVPGCDGAYMPARLLLRADSSSRIGESTDAHLDSRPLSTR